MDDGSLGNNMKSRFLKEILQCCAMCEKHKPCCPQVTFDTSKHLSESAVKKRNLERMKLQELERQREEQKRREKEEEEQRKEEERYSRLKKGTSL